jgi:hypothetical protein
MIKEIEKAKDGYEKVVEVFDELIANIELAKAEEIAQIEQKYAERLDKYHGDRSNYIEVEYVEIPEEEEFISEDTEEIATSEQMGNTTNEFQSV